MNTAMKSRRTLLCVSGLAVACWITGCSSTGGTAIAPPQQPSRIDESPSSSSTDPSPDPGTAHKIDRKIEPPKLNPKIFENSPPKTEGWSTAAPSMVELGTKMDNAIAELKSAMGHADTVFEVGGATMMTRGDIKVKSPQVFSVDYYTPGTEATRNRIVSDGKRRLEFYDEKWLDHPLPRQVKNGQLTDDEVASWPREFFRNMFTSFSDDKSVWAPLFQALASGRAGFTSTIEEKTEKVLDKNRKIYRIVATRKADAAELSVTVDGLRYLPLTVKSQVKNDKGGVDKRFWTCQWAFNGPFTEKDFIVPTRP